MRYQLSLCFVPSFQFLCLCSSGTVTEPPDRRTEDQALATKEKRAVLFLTNKFYEQFGVKLIAFPPSSHINFIWPLNLLLCRGFSGYEK